MKYNKLITRAVRRQQDKTNEERGSGRTTALILEFVSQAIRNPGAWIWVRDHEAEAEYRNLRVRDECSNLAALLKLQHFEKKQQRDVDGKMHYYIRSNHFTDNPWDIE